MNPKAELVRVRHQYLQSVRQFFSQRDFLELVTPTLVSNPGLEVYLEPFQTDYVPSMVKGQKKTFYLPTSPEYHLKKILALGCPKIFEIAKSFRNGESSAEHEPEFLMLEWYRCPGSYKDIANDFELLLKDLANAFSAEAALWSKVDHITVAEAFLKYAEISLDDILCGKQSLEKQCESKYPNLFSHSDDFETLFNKILVTYVEPKLGQQGPTFLWDYPASMCALAQVKPQNALYCERFEVYWRGIELANAFGELTDEVEQRRRCLADIEIRKQKYGFSPPLDESFLQALGQLKHPAGGVAVGLDRLLQCLLGKKTLQDVLLFPKKFDLS